LLCGALLVALVWRSNSASTPIWPVDGWHSTFFTLYWILTGFHFLHVLLGMLIRVWVAALLAAGLPRAALERAGIRRAVLAHDRPGVGGAVSVGLCDWLRVRWFP
jgi:hypothetical protein